MGETTANDALSSKTDEEIQAELSSIKKKYYDQMDTQLEKDLIIEEREKLAVQRRQLDNQIQFLKQKINKVYNDDLMIKEYFPKEEVKEAEIPPEENFYDITKNYPLSPAPATPQVITKVPQRKNR